MNGVRHFLDLDRVDARTLRRILDIGVAYKTGQLVGPEARPLSGKTLAMIFERPSTRTRVSFEVAMKQLGGEVVVLSPSEMQLGRGETVGDTARVLSRYVDGVMARILDRSKLMDLATNATVPVINGLTSQTHPCQLMADVMTFEEHRGPIEGRIVAWSGDGNNMATTWIQAAARFSFEIRVASPEALRPPAEVVAWARKEGARVVLTEHPEEAVEGADCVVTDTWVSMGREADSRHNLLAPFRVDDRLMARAASDAIFMHCLPAHREDEVTGSVLDGPQSVVWDEAENRLHAQKGILTWCMC